MFIDVLMKIFTLYGFLDHAVDPATITNLMKDPFSPDHSNTRGILYTGIVNLCTHLDSIHPHDVTKWAEDIVTSMGNRLFDVTKYEQFLEDVGSAKSVCKAIEQTTDYDSEYVRYNVPDMLMWLDSALVFLASATTDFEYETSVWF